jgi:hypothetical protein
LIGALSGLLSALPEAESAWKVSFPVLVRSDFLTLKDNRKMQFADGKNLPLDTREK